MFNLQSRRYILAQTHYCLYVFALKLNETCFGREWAIKVLQQFPERGKTRFDKRQKQNKQSHFKLSYKHRVQGYSKRE